MRPITLLIGLTILSACHAVADPAVAIGALRFLGATTVPNDAVIDGTPVGGLSGIDYDPATGEWAIISDDKSELAPARFYLARIEPTPGAPKVTLQHAIIFKQANGQPYPSAKSGGEVPDPESIRFDPAGGKLWWSSEGDRKRGLSPFVRETKLDGAWIASLPMPSIFTIHPTEELGPRHNLSFEGLSFTPSHEAFWVGMETALYQDGPIATVDDGAVARFTKFDRTGKVLAQYAYDLDPIQHKPAGPHSDNGVSEILALSEDRLLVIERSGVEGADGKWTMYIRLYEAVAKGATDISAIASLKGATYQPMQKRLVLNLATLPQIGTPVLPWVDNIEGVSFGPVLPDGHRSLVLVSDNNFNKDQVTQFLAFEVLP